jgi:DNA-binding NarL/FixJ family response regulator
MMEATRVRIPAHQAGERHMIGRDAGGDTTAAPAETTNPIRLLLVDDKLIVREGVRAFLEERSGFDVIGQASSIAEATASHLVPDVVITDLVLPDARGRDVVIALRNRFARAAIFVLTEVDQRSHVESIVAEGVGGYVLKTATADEFVSGLRSAALGVQYVQARLRAEIERAAGQSAPEAAPGDAGSLGTLTAKEREVLRLLVLGHTNAEIAGFCAVSLRTVEARRARVLQKLGVRTRAELVRVANRIGDFDLEL